MGADSADSAPRRQRRRTHVLSARRGGTEGQGRIWPPLLLPADSLSQQRSGTRSSFCKEANRRQSMVPPGGRGDADDRWDEAMNMIRKGQVRWLPKGDIVGQLRFVEQVFGIAG